MIPHVDTAEEAREIADRLRTVVDTYGPEALAVSTSGWNTQTTHGFDRRFMNLLGSPNWISLPASTRCTRCPL